MAWYRREMWKLGYGWGFVNADPPFTNYVRISAYLDEDGGADAGQTYLLLGSGPAVGWETYSTNRVRVLLPWIALSTAIIAGALIFVRHRRAQS